MLLQYNRMKKIGIACSKAAGLMLATLLLAVGCGSSEQTPAENPKAEPSSAPDVKSEPVAEKAPEPTVPAPTIPADAPLLSEIYPTLTSRALQQARLTDLADDVLLQAEGVSITESDLMEELEQAPPEMREQLRKNAFFILGQKATTEILTAMAQNKMEEDSLPQDQLLKKYFDDITGDITVTDAEIEAFYDENRDMVGDAPLDQVKSQIEMHLEQQKQQQAIEDHISALGDKTTIAVDADWVAEQAKSTLDNPIDRARASGTPTFVSFGADTCMPCQQMKPFREAVAEKYGDRLNVVYVHVNQDQILASRYGVRGIPHVIFFDADGHEVHAQSGLMTQEQIEEWVQEIGVDEA